MKRIFTLAVLALLMAQGLSAQTKLSMRLNHVVQSKKTAANSKGNTGDASVMIPMQSMSVSDDPIQKAIDTNGTITVIGVLADKDNVPTAALQALGVTVTLERGKVVVMKVPVDNLEALAEIPEFVSLEEDKIMHLNNNLSQEAMKVTTIQDATKATAAGLDKTYSGKGVVVGVFDSGIDFNHNNFRDPATHQTRIKKAIEYRGSDLQKNPPAVITDPTDIDTMTTDNVRGSHGTHTSSTAAGSYAGKYVNKNGATTYEGIRGIAYESDLVLAGTPILYNTNQMHALDEMDKTATELNEPLVVNLSLGSTDWIDGKSENIEFYNEFTDNGNKPGRIVCISAGNDGDSNCSIKTTLNSGNDYTVRTFIPDCGKYNNNGTIFYGYSPDIKIYSDDTTPFTVELEYYKMKDGSFAYSHTSSKLEYNSLLSYAYYSNHDGRYAAYLNFNSKLFSESDSVYCALKVSSTKNCGIRIFACSYSGSYSSPCNLVSRNDIVPSVA